MGVIVELNRKAYLSVELCQIFTANNFLLSYTGNSAESSDNEEPHILVEVLNVCKLISA